MIDARELQAATQANRTPKPAFHASGRPMDKAAAVLPRQARPVELTIAERVRAAIEAMKAEAEATEKAAAEASARTE